MLPTRITPPRHSWRADVSPAAVISPFQLFTSAPCAGTRTGRLQAEHLPSVRSWRFGFSPTTLLPPIASGEAWPRRPFTSKASAAERASDRYASCAPSYGLINVRLLETPGDMGSETPTSGLEIPLHKVNGSIGLHHVFSPQMTEVQVFSLSDLPNTLNLKDPLETENPPSE